MPIGQLTAKQILKGLEDVYVTIDNNFPAAFAKCKDDDERSALTSIRDAARDAYWKGIASTLADNNRMVQGIHEELKATTGNLKNELKKLRDITAIIKTATEAVRLAASLALLAAAA